MRQPPMQPTTPSRQHPPLHNLAGRLLCALKGHVWEPTVGAAEDEPGALNATVYCPRCEEQFSITIKIRSADAAVEYTPDPYGGN